MKQLRLDHDRLTRAYTAAVSAVCDELLEEYLAEIKFQMRTQEGKESLLKESEDDAKQLRRRVIGGAFAILDSFGSGSLMDKTNPNLPAYENSAGYNPLRREKGTTAILGRPAGSYTDIFGERQTSSGHAAGRNLEKVYVNGKPLAEPMGPSKAFEQAWNWFTKGQRIEKRLKEMNDLFFQRVRENPGQFFRYGEV